MNVQIADLMMHTLIHLVDSINVLSVIMYWERVMGVTILVLGEQILVNNGKIYHGTSNKLKCRFCIRKVYMVLSIFLGILAIIALIDLIFLFIQIIGEGAAGIVSWICYPFFGLIPLPLIWGLFSRILEGGALFLFIGRVLS